MRIPLAYTLCFTIGCAALSAPTGGMFGANCTGISGRSLTTSNTYDPLISTTGPSM